MQLAVLQSAGRGTNVESNLAQLERAAGEAAAAGARLLVAPEMFLSGYNIGAAAVRRAAAPADGEVSASAAAIAKRHGIAVVYGYPELGDDGAVYNAAALVDANGQRLANHRKSHLFGALDREAFSAGDGAATTARIGDVPVGLLICYDVEFPENVRTLALAGVDLVLVPTALMRPYEFVPERMVPSRAYENQVFVAYANRCGREGELEYCGASCIVGPDGKDLARAGADEALITARLDRDALARSRALNTYLADRRPALYRGLIE